MRFVMLVLCILFVVGCGGDDQKARSCEEVVGHFYAVGCAMLDVDGNVVALAQSVRDCNTTMQLAYQAGGSCPGVFNNLLNCMDETSGAACGVCNAELGALHACS